jgi:ArsR family transcriptional regulator
MTGAIPLQERKRGMRCCDRAAKPRLSLRQAEQLSEDLQILAHPVRLQLLEILSRNEGRVCVCDLEAALPVKQPTVSHHLRLLREAGLIDCERQGLWVYYFLKREALSQWQARVAEPLKVFAA